MKILILMLGVLAMGCMSYDYTKLAPCPTGLSLGYNHTWGDGDVDGSSGGYKGYASRGERGYSGGGSTGFGYEEDTVTTAMHFSLGTPIKRCGMFRKEQTDGGKWVK